MLTPHQFKVLNKVKSQNFDIRIIMITVQIAILLSNLANLSLQIKRNSQPTQPQSILSIQKSI